MRYLTIILTLLTCFTHVCAEDTSTQIFDPNFRTLKVQGDRDLLAPPVMRLGSNDRIIITFDEIGDDVSYLQYNLIHCNADWQPSQLLDSEIVDGFNIARVTDYAFSSNTFVHFVNYRIEIPNDDIRILVSGNYLLRVFDEYDPDNIILQVRFYVVDPQVSIGGEATARTDKGFLDDWQQLNLELNLGNFRVRDPYTDLVVVVEQNNRPQTRRIVEHPRRVSMGKVIYEHIPELIFPASNEFRRFDIVRTTYPGMHVDSVRYGGTNYHAWLAVDSERADRDYLYDRTQNGHFVIDEYNSTEPDLGADYVTVHFALDIPEMYNADIYVDGEMTGYRLSDANRLKYNPFTKRYETQIPLKQGVYNYQYVVAPHDGSTPTPTPIEGNKYETQNEYNVAVYQREPGMRADKLIGYSVIRFHP